MIIDPAPASATSSGSRGGAVVRKSGVLFYRQDRGKDKSRIRRGRRGAITVTRIADSTTARRTAPKCSRRRVREQACDAGWRGPRRAPGRNRPPPDGSGLMLTHLLPYPERGDPREVLVPDVAVERPMWFGQPPRERRHARQGDRVLTLSCGVVTEVDPLFIQPRADRA